MSLDAFGGVMVNAHGELTVQSLLELPGTAAHTELMSQATFIQGPPTEITLDEDDVFQCGKCKKVFTSFQLFMFHKKEHQLSRAKFLDSTISLSLDGELDRNLDGAGLVDQEICLQNRDEQRRPDHCPQPISGECMNRLVQHVSPDVLEYAALNSSAFDGLSTDISQPMMLEDSDPLNFTMEQSVLSISRSNQLPEGTYISTSSMASLDSSVITKAMQDDTCSNTAWLLANKDNNLNLVATGFAEDRTLFLGGKRFLLDGGKTITHSLDDLLPDVSYASNKELFLSDSSMTVSEVIGEDGDSRSMLQSGEYILKNSMDYISSNDLLTEFANVGQQELVNNQNQDTMSVSVLEVDIPSLSSGEMSSSVMETPVMEGNIMESSIMETSMLEDRLIETPTMMENSIIENHIMENHIIENHMIENQIMESSMMEQTMMENGMIENHIMDAPIMEPPMMDPPMIEDPIMETPVDGSVLEAPVIDASVSKATIIETPVVEEASVIDVSHEIPSGVQAEVTLMPSESHQGSERPDKAVDTKEATWEPRPLKLECPCCEKKFAKQFDLRQHLRSHTGEKPFQCIVCGRAFAQKSNVKKHMETHKVWPKSVLTLPKNILQKVESKKKESETGQSLKSAVKPVACDNKKEDTTDQENIREEEEVQYIIDNSYICQFCDASFDSYFELKTHLKTHQNEKVYLCNQKECNQTFPDLKSFVHHTQLHCSQEACYRCHVCKETFKTLADLGIHQYSHSSVEKASSKKSGDRLICPDCRSRFVTIEAFENHMLMASHNHPCPECQRVFSCERNLRRHLNTHSTACPYVCKECGKGFKTETYLNVHLTMHSSERPFACEHCNASFTRKDRLSRHLLIHQESKRMKCPFSAHFNCTKEFTRKDKLKIHILSHVAHKVKSMSCQYCKQDFKKPTMLRKHEKQCARELQNENLPHRKAVKRKGAIRIPTNKTKGKLVSENDQQATEVVKKVTCKLTPKARVNRKKPSSPEITPESSQDERASDTNNENVPTIEIIVMPLSLNMRNDVGDDCGDLISGSSGSNVGVYRLMITSDGAEYPVDLTTGSETLLSRLDCDNEGGINLLSTDQEVAVYSAPADMQ